MRADARADVVLVGANLVFATSYVAARLTLDDVPPATLAFIRCALGGAVLVPLATRARPSWTALAVLGALYLAVVITALAYLVWNWALERVPAPRAAIFLTVQPITGALLGVVLLGDAFTVFTATGGVLIVAGLVLTARP